jgi:hypothetical protein
MKEPVAIVFYPENPGITPAIREWQARNPDWRMSLDEAITCPVCGLAARAVADFALLDREGVKAEVTRYREQYLRAACSDHYWPTLESWAMMESSSR